MDIRLGSSSYQPAVCLPSHSERAPGCRVNSLSEGLSWLARVTLTSCLDSVMCKTTMAHLSRSCVYVRGLRVHHSLGFLWHTQNNVVLGTPSLLATSSGCFWRLKNSILTEAELLFIKKKGLLTTAPFALNVDCSWDIWGQEIAGTHSKVCLLAEVLLGGVTTATV